MSSNTPKHFVEAHRLICGYEKLTKKHHGTAEFRHLTDVRRIFEDRNVIGLGIAEKTTEGRRTRDLSLCFYVEKKQAKRRATISKLIPPVMSVNGKAVITDVFELGIVRAQSNIQSDPIRSGFSVSHKRALSAGTLGLIVSRGGKYYVLSNSHVLARSGQAVLGDEVIYPGRFDSEAEQSIGTLADFVPFEKTESPVNRIDAALAEIGEDFSDNIDFRIHGAARPLRIVTPERDMRVIALGRSSGRVESTIKDINHSVVLRMPGLGKIGFANQVLCDPYTDDGDSGSVVVDKTSGGLVGLHVGGSEKGSIFTSLENVRQGLSIKFQLVDF